MTKNKDTFMVPKNAKEVLIHSYDVQWNTMRASVLIVDLSTNIPSIDVVGESISPTLKFENNIITLVNMKDNNYAIIYYK